LLPEGVTVDIKGMVYAGGRDLGGTESHQLSYLRASFFGVIFQDPISALNPEVKVGSQLAALAERFADMLRNRRKRNPHRISV